MPLELSCFDTLKYVVKEVVQNVILRLVLSLLDVRLGTEISNIYIVIILCNMGDEENHASSKILPKRE